MVVKVAESVTPKKAIYSHPFPKYASQCNTEAKTGFFHIAR